jgi:hypothetical protein
MTVISDQQYEKINTKKGRADGRIERGIAG